MPNAWRLPYASRRAPVFARNLVATSQPLAAQAGIRTLLAGGNAVDAALATAITLTIVEPSNNGIGSDAFALIWDGRALHGLNASGRAPAGWTPERFAGRDAMPERGWDAVTVPGAVSAWVAASERFGALPFEDLFAPAIEYARDGFQVGPYTGLAWRLAERSYADFPEFASHFLPGGRSPRPGERFTAPDTAATLEEIAATRGESFYRGALAERIAAASAAAGGAMTADDLAAHRADWVEPVSQRYHDVRLHEIPPNGQGLAALIALGVLEHHDLAALPVDSVDSVHLQVEAMKVGWSEAARHFGDPDSMALSPGDFLEPGFLAARAAAIDPKRAAPLRSHLPTNPDTVYLTAADADGRMVSFIQSNYRGFGSGIVVPGTGIALQNRGSGFTLEPGHPNRVGPRKRPFHTIIPGFVTWSGGERDGEAAMSFGVMGGHMQAQGHVQMVVRVRDYDQNPQAASDAPRWQVREDGALRLEKGFDPDVIEGLRERGHELVLENPPHVFGGAQLITRVADGYCGASDHRTEGLAIGL
ncbi:MAG: gamma-glutamyltransferase family protein [Deltaproteobacteria bacterium]|nr:gamma-glutamyltransferase family protein [Deltaproteobacteria bacterium]MBW2413429.1 gamma-glutamyltransferase family protein [Deltaproteobacteria bacterium]